MSLTLKAPAKVNLFLEIKNKRPDGYHNLETIMQTVSLCDELVFEPKNSGISLNVYAKQDKIPDDESNLAYKAAKLFREFFKIDKGIKIILKKNIPSGAGLGGGSSDAASVILGLQKFWNIEAEKQTSEKIAAKIGADVPFFLTGSTALCEGIGEKITPLKPLKNLNAVIVKPNFAIATTNIYKKIKFPLSCSKNINKIKEAIEFGLFDKQKADSLCFNRLEEFVINDNPEILEIKNYLKNLNCASFMSGSGSAVFGIYDAPENKENLKCELSKKNWNFYFVNDY
ncbi:MAG: 4-(cytidine 5'-diphospho)-2-C-methyl-D-erythritol kinase [Elusimicrobiota bacterium]|jgi:4-diphosphocytidyl-2-C-methyl-D-erythritol kinase|nr:4-(cytidine 5'-diphospho)-2-C-methyl-D-erythritol kinase [Elusimicrobiota bacterium]